MRSRFRGQAFGQALLLIGGMAWLYPFLWTLGSSLKTTDGFFSQGHGYTIIPVFDVIRGLRRLNTLWAVIIVQAAGGIVFATFLFMGYFMTMDRELEDAARVDGANFHQLFWRVMLPLAGPMLATVALFTFISAWNSFFIPLVFTLARPELHTLAVGMYAFVGQNSTQWTYLCAGSVLTLVPIILVFVLLQRYFVNGIAGAVKA